MNGGTARETSSEVETAERFLRALQGGRIVEALDTFAADAVIREGDGREHRGLREIALSLLPYRIAGQVDIVGIHRSTHGVTALLKTRAGVGDATRDLRATFRISGRHIRSVYLRPT